MVNKCIVTGATGYIGSHVLKYLPGISGKKCLFINYPMCIQRWLYKPTYRIKWPSYIYVGVPRMLSTLEKLGSIHNWEESYREYLKKGQFNTSTIGYMFDILYWATRDKEYYKPLVKEINKHQTSIIRKCITHAVYLPDFITISTIKCITALLKLTGRVRSI